MFFFLTVSCIADICFAVVASLCTETTETSSLEALAAEEREYSASPSTLHKEPIFSTPKSKILKDTYNQRRSQGVATGGPGHTSGS